MLNVVHEVGRGGFSEEFVAVSLACGECDVGPLADEIRFEAFENPRDRRVVEPDSAERIDKEREIYRAQLDGWTTPSTALVAIAASTAWPPARRTARPAAVAR